MASILVHTAEQFHLIVDFCAKYWTSYIIFWLDLRSLVKRKSIQSFWFFFLLKLLDYLWEQLIFIPFFDNFIFWKRLFPKIGPYFCQFAIKWTQVQTIEYFPAWFNFLGRNLYLVGCANVCTKSAVYYKEKTMSVFVL